MDKYCCWFPSIGTLDLKVWEKVGAELKKEHAKGTPLPISIHSTWPLIPSVLVPWHISDSFDESDYENLELIQDKKCIVLLNKTDLNAKVTEIDLKEKLKDDTVIIKTSTKENIGIEEFENAVKDMFLKGSISGNDEIMITNMRHKEALLEAFESLNQVKRSLLDDMPEDFYSIDLMSAYASLGTIIGEEVGEDLVNEIFSKFCMGK